MELLPIQIASQQFFCTFDSGSSINIVSIQHFQLIQNSSHREFEVHPIHNTISSADCNIFSFHGYFNATIKSASKSIHTKIYICYRPIPRPIINFPSFLALK